MVRITRFMKHPRHCAPEKPVALIALKEWFNSSPLSSRFGAWECHENHENLRRASMEFLDLDDLDELGLQVRKDHGDGVSRCFGTGQPARGRLFAILTLWMTLNGLQWGATGASTAKVWVALFIMALLSCLCSPFDCGEMWSFNSWSSEM